VLVFRGIHESQKPAAVLRNAWGFSLFSLFFPEFISERHPVRGGNPGFPTAQRAKEQRNARCSFAVFHCFYGAMPVKTRVALPPETF
jgi:hypothetical protein